VTALVAARATFPSHNNPSLSISACPGCGHQHKLMTIVDTSAPYLMGHPNPQHRRFHLAAKFFTCVLLPLTRRPVLLNSRNEQVTGDGNFGVTLSGCKTPISWRPLCGCGSSPLPPARVGLGCCCPYRLAPRTQSVPTPSACDRATIGRLGTGKSSGRPARPQPAPLLLILPPRILRRPHLAVSPSPLRALRPASALPVRHPEPPILPSVRPQGRNPAGRRVGTARAAGPMDAPRAVPRAARAEQPSGAGPPAPCGRCRATRAMPGHRCGHHSS